MILAPKFALACFFVLALASASASFKHHPSHFLSHNTRKYVDSLLLDEFEQGVNVLMSYFSIDEGTWNDPNCVKKGSCVNGVGFWYWGNAAHILADYQNYASKGRQDYSWALPIIRDKNQDKMVSADYFDDEGWWGLAMIHSYRATGDKTYLNQAKNIANDMKNRGGQSVCGNGGIFWDADKTQVGAIANELFISLNAKIALFSDPAGTYKNDAINAWNWLQGSGLIGTDSIILDHFAIQDKNKCGDLVPWTFTYTNGVILSGLVDLYKLTKDQSYMDKAESIAKAAIMRFAKNGIISDDYSNDDPSTLAEDGFLFKGAFVENLGYLARNTNDLTLKASIATLLVNNLALLVKNQDAGEVYAYAWNEPSSAKNSADIVTHLSGLYLIDALVQLTSVWICICVCEETDKLI